MSQEIFAVFLENCYNEKQFLLSKMAESQNIEWKEPWRDEYLKWICGFANAQDERRYIGTKDDGTVIGVSGSKKLLEDIPNKIQTTMGILADVNLLSEDGKDYIEIVVNPSNYPVNYKGKYHYRSGSTKQQLRGIALTDYGGHIKKSPSTARENSTHEFELSNQLNTAHNSFAPICILQTGAICIFSKLYLRNSPKPTSIFNFYGLRVYERGHQKNHPLSRLRKEVRT